MQTSELAVTEYHAHVYFFPWTKDSALALREALVRRFDGQMTLHNPSEGPRGPHVHPMFGVDIPLEIFTECLSFLILNHGPHSVLIHPVTGNELLDHSHHALWLGSPQPLRLDILV